MLGQRESDRFPGDSSRKNYLRSVSWTDRSPSKPNPRPQSSSKARSCLPPLQPLSIARRPLEEWPKAGPDDLGVWPNPQTPRSAVETLESKSNMEQPVREFQFKKDKLAFFDKECSRIADHIYLGSDAVARNREILRQNGITHVLNCVGFVCPEYFKSDLVYKTLWLRDSPSEDITSILYDVFDYFEDVREQGGRVFVHCCQGVSRSNSLVIAYLMWREGQSFEDAFQYVKAARGVTNPNMGFAGQLLQCQKRVHALPASPSSVLRMYRMAPHSAYDPLHLVPKMLSQAGVQGLDSRGAFIVHVPTNIFIWLGRNCSSVMSNHARTAANQVVQYERAQGPIVNIKEGEEPIEFWDALTNGQIIADGCSKVEVKREDDLLSVDAAIAATICKGVGEKKVDDYDLDFEIFNKALSGGVVPPFSVSKADSETSLPARENGWGRLRHKFANGVVKEFVTSSKMHCESIPSNKESDVIIDTCKEKHSSLVFSSSSASPSADPCGSSDYFVLEDIRSTDGSDMIVDTCKEELTSVVGCSSASLSANPCGSRDSFDRFQNSPNSKNKANSEVEFSIPLTNPSFPSPPPCGSLDSFSYFPDRSPKFSSKSSTLSPSTSDNSSSLFTFSPSSSNLSDLSYLSSQQPSPSGLEATEPFCVNLTIDLYKETLPSPAKAFFSNNAPGVENAYFPSKGTLPSIAERRGSNPPPWMLLPSVDESSQVPRNLIRSWSFSLPDVDEDTMIDIHPEPSDDGSVKEEQMLDTDISSASNGSQSEIKEKQECSTSHFPLPLGDKIWRIVGATTPVLYHWPSMNKVIMDTFCTLDSRSVYLLWAPDLTLLANNPGVVYVWLGREVSCEGDSRQNLKMIDLNFLNQIEFPTNASVQIVKEGEEPEQFLNLFQCFSFQKVENS
uniref:Protein-tyrosine-phosphatase MKP1 n=1 Tax=Rhizophora mucronata TaxID=61149 RepID=A0A2P2JDK5_RHIMU